MANIQKFCPVCGTATNPDDSFCLMCGTPVRKEILTRADMDAENINQYQSELCQNNSCQPVQYQETVYPQKKKKKLPVWIIVLIVIAVAPAVLVVGGIAVILGILWIEDIQRDMESRRVDDFENKIMAMDVESITLSKPELDQGELWNGQDWGPIYQSAEHVYIPLFIENKGPLEVILSQDEFIESQYVWDDSCEMQYEDYTISVRYDEYGYEETVDYLDLYDDEDIENTQRYEDIIIDGVVYNAFYCYRYGDPTYMFIAEIDISTFVVIEVILDDSDVKPEFEDVLDKIKWIELYESEY